MKWGMTAVMTGVRIVWTDAAAELRSSTVDIGGVVMEGMEKQSSDWLFELERMERRWRQTPME